MSDELRMDAVVGDKFSKNLSLLQRMLGGIKAPNLDPGMKAFDRFQESVRRSTVAMNEGYNTAVTTIGLKNLAIAGTVATLADSIRAFAGTANDLKKLSGETGISISMLQALQTVAGKVGSSSEEVSQGLQKFYGNLYDVKRGVSDLIPLLMKLDPTGSLVNAMRRNSPEKALDIVMQYLGKLRAVDVEGAGRLSEELFGTRGFARMMKDPEKFQRLMKETMDRQVKISPEDLKAAQQYKELLNDMIESADKLRNTLGRALLPGMNEFLKSVTKSVETIEKLSKGDVKGAIANEFGIIPGGNADAVRRNFFPNESEQLKFAREKLARLDEMLEKADPQFKETAAGRNMIRNRNEAAAEVRRLEEAMKSGAKEGIKEGLQETVQRMSFGGGSIGGAQLWNASLGGAGGGVPGGGFGGSGGGATGELGGRIRRGLRGGGEEGGDGGATPNGTPFRGSPGFNAKAPQIMRRLMDDFGITKEQAAGIVGNFGHETGGFKHHQEINPVGGGRGGIGWAQWTGPRRRAFEAWSKANGLDVRSDEAAYGFLAHELRTTEKGALAAVRRSTTAQEAMFAFERNFERSGAKAYGSRAEWTRRAMRAFGAAPEGTPSAAFPKSWMPGQAYQSAPGAGGFGLSGPEQRGGKASLDVTVRSDGQTNVKANGGELFDDVNVNRGRSMPEAVDV